MHVITPRKRGEKKCIVKVRNRITGATTDHVRRNNETILTLVKLGILEIVDDTSELGEMIRTGNGAVLPAMGPPAQQRWYVAHISLSRTNSSQVPAIVFQVGAAVYESFTGAPENMTTGCRTRFDKNNVPPDILKQYVQTHKDFYKGDNLALLRYTQGF